MKDLFKRFMNLNTTVKHNITSLFLAVIIVTVLVNVKSTHFGAVYVSGDVTGHCNLPVVMYHSVLSDSKRISKYVITPEILKKDLEYLKNNGYTTITTSDLINFCEKGEPLPEKAILLTFDDGYYNNFSYVYPILKEMGQKAVLSVVGTYADAFSKEKALNNNYSHATWAQIKEMSESGLVEIENHSYDMHDLSRRKGVLRNKGEDETLWKENLISDTQRNSDLIETATGKRPGAYTYPFGAVNVKAKEIIKSCGFKVTYGCEEGINVITRDPDTLHDIKRFNRDGTKTTEEFFGKILKK